MDNLIKVTKINPLIEEEAEFLINNKEVLGFNISPQKLEVGKEYKGEVDIFINDFLEIEEQEQKQIKEIKHLDNFRYMLWGELIENNILDVGFFITSELFEDYQYLVGKSISLEIDRLQIYVEECKNGDQ